MAGLASAEESLGRWPLIRWFISSGTLNVPQAGGPVAFSLLALSLTGDTSGGAAMILAMTLAQVVGAVPITRLGRGRPLADVLRALVLVRTVALLAVALCAEYKAPFPWLIALAAAAGVVNGAAHGYTRAILNQLTPASRLPRALGISATLNETTFVLAPVAASGLSTFSPIVAVLVLAILGAIPAVMVPRVGVTPVFGAAHASGSLLTPAILLWLLCAAAGGATVASIEIGSVALALSFGYEPTLAFIFTVPLCLSSVAGGIWVSVRNRMATHRIVLAQLSIMAFGVALAAFHLSVGATIVGTLLMGSVMAPLSTYYSLILDTLSPLQRRAEVFALLRTANAVGVIFASAVLTAVSHSMALIVVTGLIVLAVLAVASRGILERYASRR